MNNDYNPWQISTMVLLLIISLFAATTGNFDLTRFEPLKAITAGVSLAMITLTVQLPQLIKSYIAKRKWILYIRLNYLIWKEEKNDR